MRAWPYALLFHALGAAPAEAEPRFLLKLATIAPEGSSFDREFRVFSREVENATEGNVKIKWYVGGIVGNDLQVHDRLLNGQIDGAASAGPLCEREAPSWRIFNFPALFQERDETSYVADRLRPILSDEFRRSGLTLVIIDGLGPEVLFSRRPISSYGEFKATRLYEWKLSNYAVEALTTMDLNIVPLEIFEAGRAYEDNRVDGFLSIPTAALAYQWFSQARYIADLRVIFRMGCLVVANRAFDRLPIEYQQVIRSAAAKAVIRLQDIGRRQDEMLLGGLFERQGLKSVPVNETFRAQFLDSARSTRNQLAAKLGMDSILDKVLSMLADYRAEHTQDRKR